MIDAVSYRRIATYWGDRATAAREADDQPSLTVAILALCMCGAALHGEVHPTALEPDDPRIPRLNARRRGASP